MPFFYDRVSGQSGLTQFKNYLSNNYYLWELSWTTKDVLNYQLVEIRRGMARRSQQERESLDNLASTICGTLEAGFNQVTSELVNVNDNLNKVNNSIVDLHYMLDIKMDSLIQEQQISNHYLGKIANLLKVPDSQKQRAYHIEQGLMYLKEALKAGPKSDYFKDALDEFLKAKTIEPKDYVTLQNLGLIYLTFLDNLDIETACNYFLQSARYSKVLANNAETSLDHRLEYGLTQKMLFKETASSYYYISKCFYLMHNKLKDAIKFAEEAWRLEPGNFEYYYQLCKCYAAAGDEWDALQNVQLLIELDYSYILKVFNDNDFTQRKFILDGINEMAQSYIKKINDDIQKAKEKLVDYSVAKDMLSSLIRRFSQPTYLNARKVNDLMHKKWQWSYKRYYTDEYHGVQLDDCSITASLWEILNIEYGQQSLKTQYEKEQAIKAEQRKKELEREKRFKSIVIGISIVLGVLLLFGYYRAWISINHMQGWFWPFALKTIMIAVPVAIVSLIFRVGEIIKILILLVLLILISRVWAHTSAMDGWFLPFLIKGALVFVVLFIMIVAFSSED